ncbi:MAG: hypothetical protein WDZ90_02830 [Candidatus Paceibacterota bacterium]
MKKLFVFVGDGGSGKSTLIAELAGKYPDEFKRVVTCTSRPMRADEIDEKDYHFLPMSYFINNPDLVLVKRTDNGNYYGTRKGDLQATTHHLLLTLRFVGLSKLISLGLSNVTVVRISVSEVLKTARMRQRGDTEEMIVQRLQFDATDKANVNYEDFPIIDLQASDALAEKVGHILRSTV